LRLAISAAGASEMKQRHGAVVVRGGRVLSIGINKLKNDPEHVQEYNKCSVHAEADALYRVKIPAGSTVYVARINNAGETRLSRPCSNCYSLMKSLGVSKVIYTD
jgi:deoxycytidylate deaminase